MGTQSNSPVFELQPLGGRQITARFDGGTITSDAGGLLLREVVSGQRTAGEAGYLFADRTSCYSMRANQLRLWLSSAAYVLLAALRQYGLKRTALQQARCDTIRLKLLKIGAVVRGTVRRVWFALAESYPYQSLFGQVFQNLRRWRVLPPQAAPA